MANPATAFSLYDPTMTASPPSYNATVDEGQPAPPPQTPTGLTSLSPMGQMQQQVVQKILQTLNTPAPKPTLAQKLLTFGYLAGAPTRPEREWTRSQNQAQNQIQALNAMTGMQRTANQDDTSARGWANIALRGAGLDQQQKRLDFYLKKYGSGVPIKVNVAGPNGPETRFAWQLPPTTPGQPGEVVFDPEADIPQPVNEPALATPTGYIGRNPYTNQTSPINAPGGGPAMPMPPAGIVNSVAADTSNLQGLDSVWSAYNTIRQQTGDQTPMGKYLRTVGTEKFRLASALFPDYAQYIATRRAALNAYIKSVTGAQFSVAEMQRYEKQYPEPWDDEQTAAKKLQTLRDRALSDMEAKIRAFPGVSPAAPTKNLSQHTNSKDSPTTPEAPYFIKAADDGNTPEAQYGVDTNGPQGNPTSVDLDALLDARLNAKKGKPNAPNR